VVPHDRIPNPEEDGGLSDDPQFQELVAWLRRQPPERRERFLAWLDEQAADEEQTAAAEQAGDAPHADDRRP
jgi:hypothetical protein